MSKKSQKYAFSFTIVSSTIIFLFIIAPVIYSICLSFYSGRANNLMFSGVDNYRRMFSDEVVLKSLGNNIGFCIVLTPLILMFSVILANRINKVYSEKIKSLYSVILFFPSITSPVAYAFFFKKLFATDGFLNRFLIIFNANIELKNRLLTSSGARLAIAIVCVWAWTGYYTLLILSAMQSIDPLIFKMARIDGLNDRQILLKIIFPIIKPVIMFCSVLLSGGIFQLFAEVMIISKGGPEHSTMTLSLYIYQLCFEYVPQFGYAACVAMLIFFVSGIIGVFQLKLGEKQI